MRVRVHMHYKNNPLHQVVLPYSSLREAARVLDCDRKHLAQMVNGKRKQTQSSLGNIIKVEAHEQANNTDSAIREYPHKFEEDFTLGAMEVGRGWRRVEQAVVKITTAVKWVVRKFYKPNNMV